MLLIWIAISVVAVPILCCALKKTRLEQESNGQNPYDDVLRDNLEVHYQEGRGTDVRLMRMSDPSERVGNAPGRNSLRSDITIEMLPQQVSRMNSDPNSDLFNSNNPSRVTPSEGVSKPLTY